MANASSPRIHDRASLQGTLYAARATTAELLTEAAGSRDAAILERVAGQLALMAARIAQPFSPDADDARAVDLGPLTLAHPSWPQPYVESLQQLDYAFRRFGALGGPFDAGVDGVSHRRGIVQLRYGPGPQDKRVLEPGQRLVIGGDKRAEWVLKDNGIASRHVEVWWDGVVAQVRALTDEPVGLDGRRLLRGELQNGGSLVVGRSTLRFFIEALSPARETLTPHGEVAAVRRALSTPWAGGELYAVVDAARSTRALQLLEESVDEHASLYEGEQARGLDDEAPQLVRLSPRSGLLHRLLDEGWGRAWGIYLRSAAAPKMVRRSLRRLLMVDADTRKHRLYFRFYDPRALRRFVPLITVRQRSELLAEADAIFYEQGDATLASLEPAAEQPQQGEGA